MAAFASSSVMTSILHPNPLFRAGKFSTHSVSALACSGSITRKIGGLRLVCAAAAQEAVVAGNLEVERKLYVGNIPRDVSGGELEKIFGEHGSVEKAEVMYDKYTKRSRRFGFVTMSTVEDATAAIENLNDTEIGGRKIKVNVTEKPLLVSDLSVLQAEDTKFIDSPYKVYVGNLAKEVTTEMLKEVFSETGKVLDAKVSRVPGTSKSSGFGFVSFSAEEEVEAAITSLNDKILEGQKIRVSKVVRDYLPSLVLTQRNALLSNDSLAKSSDDGYDDDDGDADDDSDEDDLCSSSASEMFDEWKEACVGAFKAMDKELIHRLPFGCSSSGSTAVTIIKMGSDVIIANLGDSRAVLGTMLDSGQVTAVQLTTDLKPGLPHEAKRIRKRNGRVFALKDEPNIQRVWLPNSNYPGLAMARAFGDLQLKDYGVIAVPQVSYHHLHDNDRFIVLATDGVWDVLSNQQVVSIIGSVEKKENAAHAVVAMAGQLWKQKFPTSKVDDCTVLCFFLHEMEDI